MDINIEAARQAVQDLAAESTERLQALIQVDELLAQDPLAHLSRHVRAARAVIAKTLQGAQAHD